VGCWCCFFLVGCFVFFSSRCVLLYYLLIGVSMWVCLFLLLLLLLLLLSLSLSPVCCWLFPCLRFPRFRRDWRYHKEMQRWFSRVPDTEPLLKTATYERGTYVYFDPLTWEQVRKYNFVLMYNQLDNAPPELPPAPARTASTTSAKTPSSSSSSASTKK
jgi:NOT2/NOT3/NOT5 C-terminal